MVERILNRKPMPYDHRDFRMADFITPAMRKQAAQMTSSDWSDARVLDQGQTPHCVGFAWAGFGVSVPLPLDWQNDMGDKIYYAAKILDKEPNQEDGSNTRSGVQAFTQFSGLTSYAFASSLDDVVTWLLVNGPVVGGTNWYDSMMSPDTNGLVHIQGNIAGGHEWMLSGVDTIMKQFKCTNSWGTSWGVKGQFFLTYDDYQRLLNEQGDACTAIKSGIVPPPPPPPPSPQKGCFPSNKLERAIRVALKELAA